jgi:hypothetical protein
MAEGYVNPVPIERVREVFSYNPLTGNLHWQIKASKNTIIGSVAGCVSGKYRLIRFDKQLFRAHRIVWAFCTGEQPPMYLDHIDGNGLNNRFWNLRPATIAENNRNIPSSGCTQRKCDGKWIAQIACDGRHFYLGTFSTKAEAQAAYIGAGRVLHKEFFKVEY